jgi:ketosteroid isomerase-like protein
MTHPNEDLLRRAYQLRERAEVEPLRQWLDDEVVWHGAGGDLRGPEQVLTMLARADEIVGRTQSHEVHALLANDEYGIVFNTVRAERADRNVRYEDRHVHVYRFRHGRIVEFWGFLADPQAAAEFWA